MTFKTNKDNPKHNKNKSKTLHNIKCNPNCVYFPDVSCNESEWVQNEKGYKERKEKIKYICGYDLHEITSWFEKCPRKGE